MIIYISERSDIMTKFIMVTTTTDNEEEAKTIINKLLEKRLVSCCQINPIHSKYYWHDKQEENDEFIIHMKSKKELYKEIEKVIVDNHSYEVPQIVAYDIVEGLDSYLNWIEEETK